MNGMNIKWRKLGVAFVAAAFLAACNGDNGGTSNTAPPPPPASSSTEFSAFVQQTFAMNEDSTPVSLDGITFDFDVNNDPTAFDALIMSGAI
jgi:hypothetical protein